MSSASALMIADGNGHKRWLPQTASAIVVIGIGQEPQQQTCENKDGSQQQRFDH